MSIPKSAVNMPYLFLETLEAAGHAPAITFYRTSVLNGWTYYVVEQKGGYCRPSDKVITIPSWLWKPSAIAANLGATITTRTKQNYRVWYICHEMAHAMDWIRNKKLGHDESFMNCLKLLCPPEAIGYESGYQTKTALACGIAPDDF